MKDALGWVFAVLVVVAMALGVPAVVIMVGDIVGWAKPSTRPAPRECQCGMKTQEAALP